MLSDKNILITGAAGQLGQLARKSLRGQVKTLRLTDIASMSPAQDGEQVWPCDLVDAAAVGDMLAGIDAVIHLGASLNVDNWHETLQVNIAGTYNIFEAARRAGTKRIIYASSHHAIGMYPITDRLDADVPVRPDSLYGLSKCFGENLARYYWDKFGIEAVCLRIGSTRPMPNEPRELSTWLSEPDFQRLTLACLTTPSVEFTIVYGVSNNDNAWWSNEKAVHLGSWTQDNAENYSKQIQQQVLAGTCAPGFPRQGGKRAEYGLVAGQKPHANSSPKGPDYAVD